MTSWYRREDGSIAPSPDDFQYQSEDLFCFHLRMLTMLDLLQKRDNCVLDVLDQKSTQADWIILPPH